MNCVEISVELLNETEKIKPVKNNNIFFYLVSYAHSDIIISALKTEVFCILMLQ